MRDDDRDGIAHPAGGPGGIDGRVDNPDTGGIVGSSPGTDYPTLEQYVLRHVRRRDNRPRVGESITVALDPTSCRRVRAVLDRLSRTSEAPRPVGLAATALEVELETPLTRLPSAGDQTISFDLGDCALMALALLAAPADGQPRRELAEELLNGLNRAGEELDLPSPVSE